MISVPESREPWSLSFVFQDFHLDHPGERPFVLAVADALRGSAVDRDRISSIAAEHGVDDLEDAKPAMLDLVLYYIRYALIDHALSPNETETAMQLKRLLRVEEGDFWRLRRREVGQIISMEMERILADGRIDYSEELHQVEVQALFDLSYDQYLELTKEELGTLVTAVLEAIATDEDLTPKAREQLRQSVSDLLPMFHLQQLVEKHDIEPYLPKRVISQRVKDLVWRRDEGCCVQCGSQGDLEFDHIIPFAKGGASTYRNVQLLCQTCNRQKSDAIG